MRVELNVDLSPEKPAPKPAPDPVPPEEKLRRYREERFLRRVALARVIEEKIAEGEFADMADVARRCGVSRARVSLVVEVADPLKRSDGRVSPVGHLND